MIKPIESVREIERGLNESKFCILSPHSIVTAFFDPVLTGKFFTGCIFLPANQP
jgi:hypothetical protein